MLSLCSLKLFLFLFQPIKSTLDQHMTTHYSGLINQLVDQAKAMFKETDPSNGKIGTNAVLSNLVAICHMWRQLFKMWPQKHS